MAMIIKRDYWLPSPHIRMAATLRSILWCRYHLSVPLRGGVAWSHWCNDDTFFSRETHKRGSVTGRNRLSQRSRVTVVSFRHSLATWRKHVSLRCLRPS